MVSKPWFSDDQIPTSKFSNVEGKVELKTTELKLATQLVPSKYHEYLSVFSEEEARTLPPRRYVDHAILIVEGGKPPFGRMYSMSD